MRGQFLLKETEHYIRNRLYPTVTLIDEIKCFNFKFGECVKDIFIRKQC